MACQSCGGNQFDKNGNCVRCPLGPIVGPGLRADQWDIDEFVPDIRELFDAID